MGVGREDRLSFRLIEKVGLVAGLLVGAALAPGTISNDASRNLVTFLGLVSASILPTISLLVNSMGANGRSVHAINKLEVELQSAMDALFLMFGCVAVCVAALVALSIQPAAILRNVPYLTTEILPRLGQAIVTTSATLIVMRAGQIPGILRRSLAVRHEIAIEEARRKLAESAPGSETTRKSFATHPDFGRVVPLQDIQIKDGS